MIYRVGNQSPNPGTFWYKYSKTKYFNTLEDALRYQKDNPGLEIWVSKGNKRYEKLDI